MFAAFLTENTAQNVRDKDQFSFKVKIQLRPMETMFLTRINMAQQKLI